MLLFFFIGTATTDIYPLSLHDALPISVLTVASTTSFTVVAGAATQVAVTSATTNLTSGATRVITARSEEHTSELQSRVDLVCRLLLEKKNNPEVKPSVSMKPAISTTRS